MTNFIFGKGVTFKIPPENEGVITPALKRVWEVDNDKEKTVWELGNYGCTVPEAEALTPEGWKTLWELQSRPDLPIATLNPETGAFEWQPASLNVYDYDGPMVRYKGQRVDQLLTPTHDVWVLQRKDYTIRNGQRWDHGSKWRKRKAGETSGQTWAIRGGADLFTGAQTMPTVARSKTGKNSSPYQFSDPVAMARLIGWYVSEGHADDTGRISIGQDPIAHRALWEEIATDIQDCGFTVHAPQPGQRQLRFAHAGLARWLRAEFGHLSKEKRLPLWVRELPPYMLMQLMDTLWKGDGRKIDAVDHVCQVEHTWVYTTFSAELADHVQEIALKLGWLTYVSQDGPAYRVHIDPRGITSLPKSTIEQYRGTVWCPTVSNGLWFMRYKGRAIVTGNSVCGDVFCKIAYEEPWEDPAGNAHAGRVRILPLNPATCYPEWHPHDRSRMIRFKLKYRFWGSTLEGTRSVFTYCADNETEALTRNGWKHHWEISTDDEVLAIDPTTDEITWQPVLAVNTFEWDDNLVRWSNTRFDAFTTPDHRWIVQDWRSRDPRYQHAAKYGWKTTDQLSGGRGSDQILLGGGTPLAFADQPKWADELVETIGWVVTEGHYPKTGVIVSQSQRANPAKCARIRRLVKWWQTEGAVVSEYAPDDKGKINWYFGRGANVVIREIAPNKQLTPEFLCSLTFAQAQLLYGTLIDADGHRHKTQRPGQVHRTEIFAQQDQGRIDGFQMLCAMLGYRTNSRPSEYANCSYITRYANRYMTAREVNARLEHYKGVVWCPSVPTKTWLARRNGTTYWTGNTELITDEAVEEYINDELISSRPNPLGTIPIAHCTHKEIASSPWGEGDITQITVLNREYNEKMWQVSDIINYYGEPVTVVTGAKPTDLQRGMAKVWSLPSEKASVFNLGLEGDYQLFQTYLDRIKLSMFELVGVPITALGQEQEISNTSGVALSMHYLPLMNARQQRVIQHQAFYRKINELVLRTLALKEPEMFVYDPLNAPPLKEGQLPKLDPRDPKTYRTFPSFPSALPIDELIQINLIQGKTMLGLESKRGALEDMGIEYPDEKLEEIQQELIDDIMRQGILDLKRAEIGMALEYQTGINPYAEPQPGSPGVQSAGGPGVTAAGQPGTASEPMGGPFLAPNQVAPQQQLAENAAGTKNATNRRNPNKSESDRRSKGREK